MKYYCTGCNYVYNEINWEKEEWIAELTKFEDLPSTFECPFCATSIEEFYKLEDEIIYMDWSIKMHSIEAVHYPNMFLENDILKFEIWNIEHPYEKDHFIYKVELYDETNDLIDSVVFWPWVKPEGQFDMDYIDKFQLRIYCSYDWVFSTNLIWLWDI